MDFGEWTPVLVGIGLAMYAFRQAVDMLDRRNGKSRKHDERQESSQFHELTPTSSNTMAQAIAQIAISTERTTAHLEHVAQTLDRLETKNHFEHKAQLDSAARIEGIVDRCKNKG